jgi:hypothetical protein
MIGEEPVAMTKRRAAMLTSSATTVRGSIKRASGADHANLRLEFPFVVRHHPAELTAIETNAGEEYSRSRMTWNS